MSQIKHITFQTIAGGTQTIALQDYDSETDIEFWGENDKAISGKIRHNIRGSRGIYRIHYEQCIQESEYRDLFNNIVSDLQTEGSVVLSEGQTLLDTRVVIPTERFNQNIEYANTIGGFVPDMEFKDIGLNSRAGGWVEQGWVESDWVEVG